jgi:hypothetical protein
LFGVRDVNIKLATKYPNVCHSGESRNPDYSWMPVEDPVSIGDQVRHDGFRTFYDFANVRRSFFYLIPRLRNLVSDGDESGPGDGGADTRLRGRPVGS